MEEIARLEARKSRLLQTSSSKNTQLCFKNQYIEVILNITLPQPLDENISFSRFKFSFHHQPPNEKISFACLK